MKRILCIVWFGVLGLACSSPSEGGNDLGTAEPPGPWSTISVLAGTPGGIGHADDTGKDARFNTPVGAVADGAGNLYIGDANGRTIRRVVLATGAVSTVFSSPSFADGFNASGEVTLDGAGNLYVAGGTSHTIEKIVLATGAMSVFCGSLSTSGSADGACSSARFNNPRGLTSDGTNLFVADTNNATIRKVVIATGMVTTLAGSPGMTGSADGTTTARFNTPYGLATDGTNVYIADNGNHVLRKLVVASGMVTTLCGAAGAMGSSDGDCTLARFKGPAGLALEGNTNLYISDGGNGTLRKLALAGSTVTTVAGTAGVFGSVDGIGSAAQFRSVAGIASDGAGNVYVTDFASSSVRKIVLSSGAVSTFVGAGRVNGSTDGIGGAARFYSARGLASDTAGNVYVADSSNHAVRKIVAATGEVTTFVGTLTKSGSADGIGAAARFALPEGLVVDGSNLYVADTANHTIRQVSLTTGAVTTVAGLARMSGQADGNGSTARFNSPRGATADGQGHLYVCDSSNNTIRKITLATGEVSTLAGMAGMQGSADGPGSAARFYYPLGVTTDGQGSLFVSDYFNYAIRKVVLATGEVSTFCGNAGTPGSSDGACAAAHFDAPSSVVADGKGSLYVGDNSTIRRIDIATQTVSTVVGVAKHLGVKTGPLPGGLNRPHGLALSPSGTLYVSSFSEDVILAVR